MSPGASGATRHTVTQDDTPDARNSAWKTDQRREWERLSHRLQVMYHYIPNPPIPHNWLQWLDLRLDIQSHAQKRLEHQLKVREVESRAVRLGRATKIAPAFRGKVFADNRSAVLAQETIWRMHEEPDPWARPGAAIWPSQDEAKYEGEGRRFGGENREKGKMDYRRSLPLVRYRGDNARFDPTALLPRHEEYELDAVNRKPTRQSIFEPPEEIYDELGVHLIGQDLMNIINDGGEPC